MRVLVADDYPDNTASMAMLLRFHGYQVVTAESGAAAQLVRTQRPTPYCSTPMPAMSGLEVARRLRKMFPNRPPVLIAITAHGFEEDRLECFEAGCDHYLVKPADPNEVARLLESYAGGSSRCWAEASN